MRNFCFSKSLQISAILALFASFSTVPPAHAQGARDRFSFSGSTRARYEALEGQSRAGFGASDDIYSLRTQLLAEYRDTGWRAAAEVYDSRVYGANIGSAIGTSEVNALELVQAYVTGDIAEPFGAGTSMTLQAGRFTLNLGSRRLIAADDYRNTTNGYTGLRADTRWADGTTATLIYTLPQVRRPDDIASIRDNEIVFDKESLDQQLWGGIVTKPGVLGSTLELAYYGFAEADSPSRPTRNRNLHNFDVRILRNAATDAFDYEAEAILQTGTIRSSLAANAPTVNVSAWFAHFDAGYTFAGEMRPRLSFEYDYVSGGAGGAGNNRFDTLFGMRRADLAPAGIYAQIGRANISTPGLRLEFELPPTVDAFVGYRAMWLADSRDSFSTSGVIDATGASGSFAGHQLEGRVRWWIVPQVVRAELNAAWIAKGSFLDAAPNAPRTGNTAYISLAMTAQF